MADPSRTQKFFQQLTAPLIEGVIIIDRQGIIQAINKAVINLFDYDETDLIGENVKILMPQSDRDHHDNYIQNYKDTGEAKILEVGREVKGKKKNGETFVLNLKVNEVEYDGQPFFMGIIHSLEAQRIAAEKVKNQAELLERAEEIGHLGHWRVDLKTNKVFWSKEVYRIHGVDPSAPTPDLKSAIDFYHPDDIDFVSQEVTKAIENNQDFTMEARLIRSDGEICHVRSSGECSTDAAGSVVSIFGIFQDITEQVKALQKIKENNEFQTLIMESIPDLMFVKDSKFRIIEANEAFLLVYPEEMRGKVIGYTTLEEYDPAEAEIFLKNDKIAFRDGISEVEEKITFPNGEKKTLLTKKIRFEKDDGQQYILGLSRDISDLKQAQDELVSANVELEEFAYRTSHDLRSPLVSSISLLSMMRKAIESDDQKTALQGLYHVEQSLRTLEGLIQSILSLTKAKNMEEECIEIDVENIIDAALSKFEYMDHFDRVDFQKDIHFSGDLSLKPSRFILIVENMISNAIKYQDLNEESPYVKISLITEGGKAVFSVEDNGLGIPENQHDKLFQMFKRFHSKTSFGSGLGLYMMKKSADILGGGIQFESLKKGSLFKLTLPLG